MSASKSETSEAAEPLGPRARSGTAQDDAVSEPCSELLAALLDGMDAALCAFAADGTITHWNREAERILGWSPDEAVGRRGFNGWAVRRADADEVERRLMAAMESPGRQVDEFALLRKDGGRVLVRTQLARVLGADGRPAGVYCAFSEVHAQIDLERSIALSEALFADASWGVVLVDVDLRPTTVNRYAERALAAGGGSPLGRPLGEMIVEGVEQLESSLHHVLAEGAQRGLSELWVTLAEGAEHPRESAGSGVVPGSGGSPGPGVPPGFDGRRRRCWRSGFLRLGSPLAEEPVPLGVAWLFHDVTEARLADQEADRLRFRAGQLHRAGRAAAESEDPTAAAMTYLDFALAGFADHAVVDLLEPGDGGRLIRSASTPTGAPGPCLPVTGGGVPVHYPPGHPALQAADRNGSVRASVPGAASAAERAKWPRDRRWPRDMAHALCTVLRSRGRTLGVITFLRGPSRPAFERPDAVYAESMSSLTATALDLAAVTAR
ncbi:PAS domain-containing protein [Streptomyces albipurpureus]|uniref:PAS domain-containing protein n=1 Tax=Streptomyces albipurpureus TaxID=2897419 RepID=A0ABT0UYG1_9ACTN|nr:PAS domain-containing protein [Streptomyces sp. CWNU-1]MCM2393306.1 PAS domain-containing protein [Streptomyces sp. CWNU-1]